MTPSARRPTSTISSVTRHLLLPDGVLDEGLARAVRVETPPKRLPGTLGAPDRLMRLLSSCTRSGVAVSFTPTNAVCQPPGEPHPRSGQHRPGTG
jgi:hypothetical protein